MTEDRDNPATLPSARATREPSLVEGRAPKHPPPVQRRSGGSADLAQRDGELVGDRRDPDGAAGPAVAVTQPVCVTAPRAATMRDRRIGCLLGRGVLGDMRSCTPVQIGLAPKEVPMARACTVDYAAVRAHRIHETKIRGGERPRTRVTSCRGILTSRTLRAVAPWRQRHIRQDPAKPETSSRQADDRKA